MLYDIIEIKSMLTSVAYLSRLPWIFLGAPLKVNGAPRTIQGNFTALQLPRSWSCGINGSLSSMTNDFNYLHHVRVEIWQKCKSIFMFIQNNLACIWGFNSLWPSDAIWWQRSGSTLATVMACCLTAPIVIVLNHCHISGGKGLRCIHTGAWGCVGPHCGLNTAGPHQMFTHE